MILKIDRPYYVGESVITDYDGYPKKVRIVTDCYRPRHHCASGWYVKTDDGLDIDSGWFDRVRQCLQQ